LCAISKPYIFKGFRGNVKECVFFDIFRVNNKNLNQSLSFCLLIFSIFKGNSMNKDPKLIVFIDRKDKSKEIEKIDIRLCFWVYITLILITNASGRYKNLPFFFILQGFQRVRMFSF